MTRRTFLGLTTGMVATAATFGLPSDAVAKYRPYPFFEMLLLAESIVAGTILKVHRKHIVFEVQETLLGPTTSRDTIKIQKFRNWTCASRWAPYHQGQTLVMVMRKYPDPSTDMLKAIGSGNEGELPWVDSKVYVRHLDHFNVANADVEHKIFGQGFYGTEVPEADFFAALRGYRSHFERKPTQDEYMATAKAVSSAKERQAYAAQSAFHQALVKASM